MVVAKLEAGQYILTVFAISFTFFVTRIITTTGRITASCAGTATVASGVSATEYDSVLDAVNYTHKAFRLQKFSDEVASEVVFQRNVVR